MFSKGESIGNLSLPVPGHFFMSATSNKKVLDGGAQSQGMEMSQSTLIHMRIPVQNAQ